MAKIVVEIFLEGHKIIISGEDATDIIKDIKKLDLILEALSKQVPIVKKPSVIERIEQREISLPEFVRRLNPRVDTDQVLSCMYYLLKYRNVDKDNIKDIKNILREARLKVPKNVNDTMSRLIQRGFIALAEDKKDNLSAWYITTDGEIFVESGLKKSEKK